MGRFDVRIQEAILIACEDMTAADELLVRLHAEARGAEDRAATLACLKALSVITAVTGADDGRWLKVCRTLAREEPENPSAWITLGQAEEDQMAYGAAGRAYLKALELSQDKRTDEMLKDSLDRIAKAMAKQSASG